MPSAVRVASSGLNRQSAQESDVCRMCSKLFAAKWLATAAVAQQLASLCFSASQLLVNLALQRLAAAAAAAACLLTKPRTLLTGFN